MLVKPIGLLRPQQVGSGFVQYGLYNESEFNTLVYTNGYIPIATDTEKLSL